MGRWAGEQVRTLGVVCLVALTATPAVAQATSDVPVVRPDAIVDLATDDGVATVNGQWRYSDARIVEVEHRAPGPDLRASGAPNRAYDIAPHAGAAEFDDSGWTTFRPQDLEGRRTNGRLSFGWYRLNVTIPENEIMNPSSIARWANSMLPLKQWKTPRRSAPS